MPTDRAMLTPEFLALQTAVAGRYALIRELGRGGMGIVFLARDVALERLVAIKLLPLALAERTDTRARFLQEARTIAGLSHPHIVPVHLVEERGALVFFVMGYVEGETLGARVRRAGPLSAAEAMRVVKEVAWALGHAHANRIVHRDVKPDNILLDGVSGRALVTDFGIARALEHAVQEEADIRGTPQYLSPEVAQGEPGDARSDLYSLGVTAWVAASGRLPFTAHSTAALLLAHIQSRAPSLATACVVPGRFAAAVDRCLLKSPDARWESAEAFAAEVDAAQARITRTPAPVRALLRAWEASSGELATVGTASVVAFAESVALHLLEPLQSGPLQFDFSILKWVFAVIAVLTAGMATARFVQLLAQTRAMLTKGYGHSRIANAQRLEAAQRLDEREAIAATDGAQRRETALLLVGAAIGSVGAFALAFSDVGGWINVIGCAGAVVLPTLFVRTLWRFTARRTSEPLWSRLLRGRAGRLLFRLVGIGAMPPRPSTALEGPEPTAMAIGQAARELYAALPPAARTAIGAEVPTLIQALEARAMRRWEDGARDSGVHDADALQALENLRLDLLRLSASAIDPAEFTAELVRARDLGEAIDREIAAREDVRLLLARDDRASVSPPPTPVSAAPRAPTPR